MSAKIFYYTGTGNSLWVAKKIADKLGDVEMHFISGNPDNKLSVENCDMIGFVFPVYIWGVPYQILEFIDRLENFDPKYCFAVVTNGGQVSRTLIQLKTYLKKKGVRLNAGFSVAMPSNYIPWGDPGPVEKLQKLFEKASQKVEAIINTITNREDNNVEKGPILHRIFFTLFYKLSTGHIREMDGKFWTDEKCNGCKICEQVCPADNILMVDGKPGWKHQCQQCYACLQWCPQQAIQYGKKTPEYERYHHPDIKLSEIIRQNTLI